MNGNNLLIDSNIIILASKNKIDLASIIKNYKNIYFSIITYIEILGYSFDNEEEKKIILEVLNEFKIINLFSEIADIAIGYKKLKKIKLPDAVILATAKYLKADLITKDIKDFQNIDNSINLIN